jgi:DNA (cytosine-5)-methyltransferase 1
MRKSSKVDQRPIAVSLFSGCGGLDVGLENAGFRVGVAMDAEGICRATFAANFPETPFIHKRIGETTTAELTEAAKLSPSTPVSLLAGGPPCPAFSKSRFYRKEKPRALDDPVAQETVGGYLRVLEDLQPRAFILENVKGLAYGVHRQALDHILATAEGLGYQTTWQVLNAADYGVPQIRERCFVVGVRGDRPFKFPEPTHAKVPDLLGQTARWVTSGDVLRDLDTEANANDEGHFAGGQHHQLLCKVPPGDNYLCFTAERGHPQPIFKWRSRYWSFLLKLSPDMPSWTIQARRSNNMGPFHWRNRILRIAEIKRLQTFPDKFDLAGSIEQQWRQVGNAVPPLLAQHLGKAILEHLKEQDAELLAA